MFVVLFTDATVNFVEFATVLTVELPSNNVEGAMLVVTVELLMSRELCVKEAFTEEFPTATAIELSDALPTVFVPKTATDVKFINTLAVVFPIFIALVLATVLTVELLEINPPVFEIAVFTVELPTETCPAATYDE